MHGTVDSALQPAPGDHFDGQRFLNQYSPGPRAAKIPAAVGARAEWSRGQGMSMIRSCRRLAAPHSIASRRSLSATRQSCCRSAAPACSPTRSGPSAAAPCRLPARAAYGSPDRGWRCHPAWICSWSHTTITTTWTCRRCAGCRRAGWPRRRAAPGHLARAGRSTTEVEEQGGRRGGAVGQRHPRAVGRWRWREIAGGTQRGGAGEGCGRGAGGMTFACTARLALPPAGKLTGGPDRNLPFVTRFVPLVAMPGKKWRLCSPHAERTCDGPSNQRRLGGQSNPDNLAACRCRSCAGPCRSGAARGTTLRRIRRRTARTTARRTEPIVDQVQVRPIARGRRRGVVFAWQADSG